MKPQNPEQRSEQLFTEEHDLSVEQREALEEFASAIIGLLAGEFENETDAGIVREFDRCLALRIHQDAIAGAAWDAAGGAAEQVRKYGKASEYGKG